MTTDDAEPQVYLGREPACGCAVAALMDTPAAVERVALELARWARQGLTIERVPLATARTALHRCPHRPTAARRRRGARAPATTTAAAGQQGALALDGGPS